MKFIIIVVCAFLVSACSSTVRNLESDQDVLPIANTEKGYLLIGIDTNTNLKGIKISGPKNINLSHNDLTTGADYILVDLPAGMYQIELIELNQFFKVELNFEKLWQFSIEPESISYVGDIEISRLGYWSTVNSVRLMNRASEALSFMERKYPSILSKRAMIHGGPGSDTFLQYALSEGK